MTLRITTKVKAKVHLTAFDPDPGVGDPHFLDEWYVNYFNIARARYLIFTEAVTLYSFVVSSNGINNRRVLEELATDTLFRVFKRNLGRLSQELFEKTADRVIICKTADRRVLGSQNDLINMACGAWEANGGADFDSINDTPMSFLGYQRPRDALGMQVEKYLAHDGHKSFTGNYRMESK